MPRRESLRVDREVDPTSDWLNEFGQALWERYGSQLSLILGATTTLIGTGEMNSKFKRSKGLGLAAVDHLVKSVRDDMPESFGRGISAKTANPRLYVRPEDGGLRKLAISFSDSQLTAERLAGTRTLGILANSNLRWHSPYYPNLSVATFDRSDVAFIKVIEEMDPFVPSKVELLPGRVEKVAMPTPDTV